MDDRTTAYARLVVDGKRLAGQSEILCCARHLQDLNKGADFPYVFDIREAERHIAIANTLTIGEGAAKKPLVTRGFQNFIIGSLFGWRKKRSKQRRYREAYIQMGRQNGKSFLSGVLCNDFATFSGYKLGSIFCTATKQAQANIVWKEVKNFIDSDKNLSELYKIKEYKHEILSLVTGCTISAIGRDTKSADGFRSILAVVDEYHAHPTDQMYKLMLDGQITVDNALTLAITTAGFNLNYPCYDQYLFCKKIISGAIEKDSQFVYIAEMDEDDDEWDTKNWAKANPFNLWLSDTELNYPMISRMAEKAIDAREKKGRDLCNFETKTLNQWVTYTGGALIPADQWAACAVDDTIEDYAGRECYLGIDLSSGGDLTSIALLFPDGESCYIWSKSYIPENRLHEHEKTDDAPYRMWVRDGLITPTSGMYGIKTDYGAILADLKTLISKYQLKIVGVGYDSHNIAGILSDLEDILDCDLTEIKQSARSLNDVTKDFQLSVKAGTVKYDRKNALLTWSVLNAIISEPNSFGEIKIDKMTQTNRIDPVDAIIDAWKMHFLAMLEKQKTDGDAALDAWMGATAKKVEEGDRD